MKRAKRKPVTAAVGRFWSSLPPYCQACWELGVTRSETVIHHIMADAPGKVGRRDHMLVVRLCPQCHNMGRVSVHLLGSEAAYERETGVDLVAIAMVNREAWRIVNGT
jgi:hypothetical protein